MRLLSISAQNFSSYRRLSLDLSGVRSVVVTGDTGAGKSSIAYAILWALWGWTRAPSVDDVVRLGQDEAEVTVTFEHAGSTFRVSRSRRLTKRGVSSLHFERLDAAGPVSLDGANARETQERIIATIGLDADLARATIFSLQKESDSFFRATPGERLGILVKLLNLSRFDEWRQAARAWRLERRDGIERTTGRIEALRETAAALGDTAAAMDAAHEAHLARRHDERAAADREAEARATFEAASSALVAWRGLQTEAAKLRVDVSLAEERNRASQAELDKTASVDVAALERVAAERSASRDGAKVELANARAAQEELRSRQDELLDERELQMRELTSLRSRRDAIVAEATTAHNEAIDDARERVRTKRSRIERLLEAIERGEKAAETLGSVPFGQQCVDAGCRFLVDAVSVAAQLDAQREELRVVQQAHDEAVAFGIALKTTGPSFPTSLQDVVDAIGVCDGGIQILDVELEDLREALGRSSDTTRERERALSLAEAAAEEAARSAAAAAAAAASADARRAAIAERTAEVARMRERIEALDMQITSQIGVEEARDSAQQALDAAMVAHRAAAADRARAEAAAEEASRRSDQAERIAKEIEALSAEIENERLAIADLEHVETGCRDVPRMVIEEVVPEIEQQANEMLARLSASGMTVRLRTQRELKTSERTAETLDIMIRDEVDERPYETFSGGESFMVDWTMRVALAHVLASRAGVPLETLLMDEGFGALDPGRVAAAAGVLAHTASMFRLLITITHVEALADVLPHGIYVRKTADGSLAAFDGQTA